MSKRAISALRKSPYCKGFFLLLPYLFTLLAVGCAVVLLFQTVIAPSEYYRVLMGRAGGVSNSVVQPDEGHIPPISYESRWATLNVDGWEKRDIPVYLGDGSDVLRNGAGMWMNSRFCGQLGKTVLSAHVTSYFHEIEDTTVGTHITVDAIYGEYVYEVVDIKVFHYEDGSLLKPMAQETEDILVMYTCYPRENGYQFKEQRIALVCKKISGKEWKTYG